MFFTALTLLLLSSTSPLPFLGPAPAAGVWLRPMFSNPGFQGSSGTRVDSLPSYSYFRIEHTHTKWKNVFHNFQHYGKLWNFVFLLHKSLIVIMKKVKELNVFQVLHIRVSKVFDMLNNVWLKRLKNIYCFNKRQHQFCKSVSMWNVKCTSLKASQLFD